MRGYGPPPDAATELDALVGYQIVVTRVREGLPGTPSHGGVERAVSTKVIVVVATNVELPAAATVGAPTVGSAKAQSRRQQATAPSDII
jgi:hypothetical protein